MRRSPEARWKQAVASLVLYGLAGASIAFWPEPINKGQHHFFATVRDVLPWATYDRIEFSANVLLFVPLGWLMSIVLHRLWFFVLAVGVSATLAIEFVQGVLLSSRDMSIFDVLANSIGVLIGIGLYEIRARHTPATQ